MAARDLFGRLGSKIPSAFRRSDGGGITIQDADELADAPLGGTRAEAMQRLQIGVTGLAAIVFMVGLAGIIGGQADQADEAAVPDAAPTTEPTAPPPQRDPLADAGVVPDIPVDPATVEAPPVAEGQMSTTAPDGTVIVPDTPPTEPTERQGGQTAPRPKER